MCFTVSEVFMKTIIQYVVLNTFRSLTGCMEFNALVVLFFLAKDRYFILELGSRLLCNAMGASRLARYYILIRTFELIL